MNAKVVSGTKALTHLDAAAAVVLVADDQRWRKAEVHSGSPGPCSCLGIAALKGRPRLPASGIEKSTSSSILATTTSMLSSACRHQRPGNTARWQRMPMLRRKARTRGRRPLARLASVLGARRDVVVGCGLGLLVGAVDVPAGLSGQLGVDPTHAGSRDVALSAPLDPLRLVESSIFRVHRRLVLHQQWRPKRPASLSAHRFDTAPYKIQDEFNIATPGRGSHAVRVKDLHFRFSAK